MQLDYEVIRWAKGLAAGRGTSVITLVPGEPSGWTRRGREAGGRGWAVKGERGSVLHDLGDESPLERSQAVLAWRDWRTSQVLMSSGPELTLALEATSSGMNRPGAIVMAMSSNVRVSLQDGLEFAQFGLNPMKAGAAGSGRGRGCE